MMEFPSVKSDQETVFTVVIGYKRSNGVAGMPALFKDIPYTLSSFPDVFDSRKPHLYTPHNLGTLLESLHPRPWALIVGPAIRPSLVPEIKAVWDAYVEGVLMRDEIYDDEWRKSAFVPVSRAHWSKGIGRRTESVLVERICLC